ncbi:FIST N-terminal domain-containing protein [Alteromonas gracilis]|uniref:FIST N-terminal domain-containing protein n=1 Tax=Alteromonas gracilis TaxID=1479524 RepID=UPI0032195429
MWVLVAVLRGTAGVFENTFVLGPDGIDSRQVVAVGFYGDNLQFGYGARGGWRSFGPARRITQAQENILYQLDGQLRRSTSINCI